ncbi:hypothetical protein RJ55_01855 [Drechmeria coniospora]|nr:hypothetical protein RJ55_01855 [Drechmeria coniospora]
MTDRYRGFPPFVPSRSSTFNPARTSLPTGIGYSSIYAGDMHIMSSATPRQHMATPRGYTASTPASGGGPATTRTYAVTPDRLRQNTREAGRTRRSTLDSANRPPIIVTTTQTERPHGSPSHPSNARGGSPVRNGYRSSDGQFYAQPATSNRTRSNARKYKVNSINDEYARLRDRSEPHLSPREVDAYRSSRPSVVYPSDPMHGIDYAVDGYQYTNAGELARYDLDHAKPSRHRRHDSADRGYYRPNISYNADQRSFNVNTSHDLSRNYNMNTSRPYEGRLGPPPSFRAFDRMSRGYDARDVPPAAPVPPSPTTSQLDVTGHASHGWESARRSRPLSLHQDGPPRSSHRESHHDEYHRSRDDERARRDVRGRDSEWTYELPRFFKDEGVGTRGFGIRTDVPLSPTDPRDRRREARRGEPKKWQAAPDERQEKREVRREDDEVAKEHSRVRDKMPASAGVAAAAAGLAPALAEGEEGRDHGARDDRGRGVDEDGDRRRRPDVQGQCPGSERTRDPQRDQERKRRSRDGQDDSAVTAEHPSSDTDARLGGEAVASASDSDDTRRASRRHRPSHSVKSNDASGLRQVKEQLAALGVSEAGDENDEEDAAGAEGRWRSRSSSPSREPRAVSEERRSGDSSGKDFRGREAIPPAAEGKKVRLVSPPKEKAEDRPLKGILKQPRSKFPEEANPVREGVAPHKEDKKLKEAPAGARWTKINRKIVNPEALALGKERFEVRDDFVIVLRVLGKEEIQEYAAATQILRERRRHKTEGDDDDDDDDDQKEDDGVRRQHRLHRHREEEEEEVDGRDRHRDRDRERRRHHRKEDEDEQEQRPRPRDSEHHHHHHHHRSFRERERAAEV